MGEAVSSSMQVYKNLSGNSGVEAYDIGDSHIDVRFRDGHTYRYTATSAGAANVAEMKRLAAAGAGLSGFISQRVKSLYAAKIGPGGASPPR